VSALSLAEGPIGAPAHGLSEEDAPLEVLLGSEDISGDLAASYGYVNRSLPDDELNSFCRRARKSKSRHSTNGRSPIQKRLVNRSEFCRPDVEMAAGWEACMTSITRPGRAGKNIKKIYLSGDFTSRGDAEDHLGFHVGPASGGEALVWAHDDAFFKL